MQTSLINRLRSSGSDNWHIQTTRESSNANYIEALVLCFSPLDRTTYITMCRSRRRTGGADRNPGRGSGFPRVALPHLLVSPTKPSETPFKATPPVAKVLSSLRFPRNSLAKHAPRLAGCSRVSCHGSKHLPFNPHSDSRPRPSELRIAKRTICDLKARRSL